MTGRARSVRRGLIASLAALAVASLVVMIGRTGPQRGTPIDPGAERWSVDVGGHSAPDLGDVVRTRTPAAQPALTVVGAMSLGLSELEILRFVGPPFDPVAPQRADGSVVLRAVLRVCVDSDELAVTVSDIDPAGEHWFLRSAFAGEGVPVLAQVYGGRIFDPSRGFAAVVLDLRQLPGVDLVVDGIDVGDAWIDVEIRPAANEALRPMATPAFRFECPAARPPRVLGDAGAELVVRARGGRFAFPTPLSAARASLPLLIPSKGIANVAITMSPIGSLVVRRAGVELEVPSRIGFSAADLQGAPPRLRHGLVSLPRLAESGHSRLLVHPVGEALHAIAIDSLRHDERGAVHVDLPVEDPSWIELVLQGVPPPAGWSVFARPAGREVEGMIEEVADGRCVLGPIAPGIWQIHWRRSDPLLFLPIAAVSLSPGVRRQVLCSFRVPTHASVRVLDWAETPAEERPVAITFASRHCMAIADQPGSFVVEVVPEERLGAELSMVFAGLGGTLTLPADHWVGTELRVSLPRPSVVPVTVRPCLGGYVELWNYYVAPAPNAPRFPLHRKLRANPDGSHHFLRGRSHAVGATERLPDGSGVFRGFFGVHEDVYPSSIDLRGRWLEVVGKSDCYVTMLATVLDLELEWSQELPAGSVRLWLPESVDCIEVRTSGGLRRYASREVGAVLIL